MIGISLSFIVMVGGLQSGVVVGMEEGIRDAVGADIILQRGYNTTEVFSQIYPLPSAFANNLTKYTLVLPCTLVKLRNFFI